MPFKDPDLRRAKGREYQRTYRLKHTARVRERKAAWKKANPKKIATDRSDMFARNKKRKWRDPDYHKRQVAKAKENRKLVRETKLGRKMPDKCDACGGNDGGIVFDHCHAKGHPRGWLCNSCNKSLGLLRDNPERLLKLIAYLKRHAVSLAPQLTLSGV
ncbi:MAG TPA: endonuclease domain-containing protein [Steroidobacteraceae bacterium]